MRVAGSESLVTGCGGRQDKYKGIEMKWLSGRLAGLAGHTHTHRNRQRTDGGVTHAVATLQDVSAAARRVLAHFLCASGGRST